MKHLNPDLDNITTVDLKNIANGTVRYIGVDSDDQIVMAPRPSNGSEFTVDNTPPNPVIVEGGAFYFDTDAIALDRLPCYEVGDQVVLTANVSAGETGAAEHNRIAILGEIARVDDTATGVRVVVRNAQHLNKLLRSVGAGNEFTLNAFNGDAAFGGVAGQYAVAIDSTRTDSIASYTLATVSNITDAGLGRGLLGIRMPSVGGFYPSTSANAGFGVGIDHDQNRDEVYGTDSAEGANYNRWTFWGWDEEVDADGNLVPVIHPDTGVRAIIVCDDSSINGRTGALPDNGQNNPNGAPAGSVNGLPDPRFTDWSVNGEAPTAMTIAPSITQNIGSTSIMTEIATNPDTNMYDLVGNAPYSDQLTGAPNPAIYGTWAGGQSDLGLSLDEGSSETSFSAATGGFRFGMSRYYTSGGIRPANTTGDRTPSTGPRSNPSVVGPNPSKAFFVLAPASTTTGLNYKDQQDPYATARNWGWSPFFSVVSGSGAIRASDGRYYISSNPDAPIIPSSPLYDPKNPTDRAVDGFYLRGRYVSGMDGHDTDAITTGAWDVRLDRTVYRIARWIDNDPLTDQRWIFNRSIDRDTICLPETKMNDTAVMGTAVTFADYSSRPSAENPVAYTRVVSGSEEAFASDVQAVLNFVGGPGVEINIEDNPDTITISLGGDDLQQIIGGLELIDVSQVSATVTSSHRTIPDGSGAWVSPSEVWVNQTGAAVDIMTNPQTFFTSNNGGAPDGWTLIGQSGRAAAVVDVSDASTPTVVPSGAIAWITDTVQYWNKRGNAQTILDPASVDFAPSNGWCRIGDGNDGVGEVEIAFDEGVLVGNDPQAGYFFNVPATHAFAMSQCLSVGAAVDLTALRSHPHGGTVFYDPTTYTQDDDIGIQIRGRISKIEATAVPDPGGGGSISAYKVYVRFLRNGPFATNDAFNPTPIADRDANERFRRLNGDTFATAENRYPVTSGTSRYCVNILECPVPNTQTSTIGWTQNSNNLQTTDQWDGNHYQTISAFSNGHGVFQNSTSPGTLANVNRRGSTPSGAQAYNNIYSNDTSWGTFMFWGYDTEENGAPVVHPDNGLPAIVVSEISNVPNTPSAPYQGADSIVGTVNSNQLNRVPSPVFRNRDLDGNLIAGDNQPITLTNVSGETLMIEEPANSGNYVVRGGTPYPADHEFASPCPLLTSPDTMLGGGDVERARYAIDEQMWDTIDMPRMFNDLHLAGPMRRPNTHTNSGVAAGSRIPNNDFAPASHRASVFVVTAPPSSNTGMNYVNPFTPSTSGTAPQGSIDITSGVGFGYTPLYSVISGSGAVRASDGRYYITPDAYGDASTDAERLDNVVADPSGFYLNGTYRKLSGAGGGWSEDPSSPGNPSDALLRQEMQEAGWNVKLDRQVAKIGTPRDLFNLFFGTRELRARESQLSYVYNRTTFTTAGYELYCLPEVFGFEDVVPDVETEDPVIQTEAAPIQNTWTNITVLDEGAIEASIPGDSITLVAGDNISINVTEGSVFDEASGTFTSNGPDTITINSTDEASVTEINNILSGAVIRDVTGVIKADNSTHVTIAADEIAYVSETELYVNQTGADIIVNCPHADFEFEKRTVELYPVVADVTNVEAVDLPFDAEDPSSWTEAQQRQYSTHTPVNHGESVTWDDSGTARTFVYLGGVGTGDIVDMAPGTFFATPPTGWFDLDVAGQSGRGACMLRIGRDQVNTRAVIDVSGASTTNAVFVPAGSVAWISATEQFWNASGNNRVVDSAVAADYTTPNWLRLGDGMDSARTVREFTVVRNVDTTTNFVEETIVRGTNTGEHNLPAISNTQGYTVQVYEQITGGYSLVLPETTVVMDNGNVVVRFPMGTVNGNVKIEIRA